MDREIKNVNEDTGEETVTLESLLMKKASMYFKMNPNKTVKKIYIPLGWIRQSMLDKAKEEPPMFRGVPVEFKAGIKRIIFK